MTCRPVLIGGASIGTLKPEKKARTPLFYECETPETEKVHRIKERSSIISQYRADVREIFHRTDHLISSEETSSILPSFESSPSAAVAGKFFPSRSPRSAMSDSIGLPASEPSDMREDGI